VSGGMAALARTRLLIVDSLVARRAHLRTLLQSDPALEVVGDTATPEVLEDMPEHHVDLVVLEAHLLPGLWAKPARPAAAATTSDPPLSGRRRMILGLVAEGLSNREIAQRTHLSELTVKGYVEEILRALAARNRVHAAVLAIRRGLI
jgi:DNA-binding NarL/FixJ family response regulator